MLRICSSGERVAFATNLKVKAALETCVCVHIYFTCTHTYICTHGTHTNTHIHTHAYMYGTHIEQSQCAYFRSVIPWYRLGQWGWGGCPHISTQFGSCPSAIHSGKARRRGTARAATPLSLMLCRRPQGIVFSAAWCPEIEGRPSEMS